MIINDIKLNQELYRGHVITINDDGQVTVQEQIGEAIVASLQSRREARLFVDGVMDEQESILDQWFGIPQE